MTTKAFYVTLIDGKRVAWLLGPFADHNEALSHVDAAWDRACDLDPRVAFAARGTSAITKDAPLSEFPKGKLNALMGIAA